MRRTTVPVFEKPVIIRPKSASDFRGLQRVEDEDPKRSTPIQLRVEQDLEVRVPIPEIQDDADFEAWHDSMHNDIEAATVAKYTFAFLVRTNN